MINKILSQDTIAAPITPIGGGVCLIRLSGSGVLSILKEIFVGARRFETHRVYYGKIIDNTGNTPEILDEVLVTVMLAPKSFTMEDVVEIGCHGGAETAQAVLALVLKCGVRLAEPGEFTKRAFLNGRIDLTQAEATADLINAKSQTARRGAMNKLSGGLSQKIKAMANYLLLVLARIEAAIDYPEHGDEIGTDASVVELLIQLSNEMKLLLNTYNTGKIVRDGINIVILGKPNVGKSSLLNALLNQERAIVTSIPGTTRDVLKEHMLIGDIPVNLCDTAGIRETNDTVESIGIERAVKEAETADLVLLIADNSDTQLIPLQPATYNLAIINKTDILTKEQVAATRNHLLAQGFDNNDIIEVSAKTAAGINELKEKITRLFIAGNIDYEPTIITSSRHNTSLQAAITHIQNALEAAQSGLSDDFITIDLTAAYHCLGEITGESLSEDIIDKIFSEFCLGK